MDSEKRKRIKQQINIKEKQLKEHKQKLKNYNDFEAKVRNLRTYIDGAKMESKSAYEWLKKSVDAQSGNASYASTEKILNDIDTIKKKLDNEITNDISNKKRLLNNNISQLNTELNKLYVELRKTQ